MTVLEAQEILNKLLVLGQGSKELVAINSSSGVSYQVDSSVFVSTVEDNEQGYLSDFTVGTEYVATHLD